MPAGLCFIVQAILDMMGSQSLLHVGALSVRLSEGYIIISFNLESQQSSYSFLLQIYVGVGHIYLQKP